MNELNSVLIEGNLTAEPEGSAASMGFIVMNVRKDLTVFIAVHCTGRIAETCLEYLHKGNGVRVVGRLSALSGGLLGVEAKHVEFKKMPEPKKGGLTKLTADVTNGVTRTDGVEIAEKKLEKMSQEDFYRGLSARPAFSAEGAWTEVDDAMLAKIDSEYGIR
jgi:single-strand DNA-binding protein